MNTKQILVNSALAALLVFLAFNSAARADEVPNPWRVDNSSVLLGRSGTKVGIGTDKPKKKLHVLGNMWVGGNMWLNTSNPFILFNERGYNAARIHHEGGHNGGILEIETYSPGWRRTDLVLREGNVGLGTSYPEANLDIHATNNIELLFSGSSPASICSDTGREMIIGTMDRSDLSLVTGDIGNRRLTIREDGRVGIGTTSPQSLLHLAGDDNTVLIVDSGCPKQSSSIQFRAGGRSRWQIGQGLCRDNTSFNIHDMVSNYIRMTITPSGNVGIGTSDTENYRLNVKGDGINSNGGFFYDGMPLDKRYLRAGENKWVDKKGGTITGALTFTSPRGQVLTFNSYANGIGVQSNTQYFRSGGGFAWYRGGDHSDDRLDPGGGDVLMTLCENGNMGLGTDNPGDSRLHVEGGNITIQHQNPEGGSLTIGSVLGSPGLYGDSTNKPLTLRSASGAVCVLESSLGIGTSNPAEKLEVNGRIRDKTGFVTPVGAMLPFAGMTAPAGWLLCNGDAVSRVSYAELFSVIGTLYGKGDGTATFNLPNLNGRTAVGYDRTQPEFETMGKTGGEKEHRLSEKELPKHGHSTTDRFPADGNYEGWEKLPSMKYGVGRGDSTSQYESRNSTGPVGGGLAHNNLQPYLVLSYIIKH